MWRKQGILVRNQTLVCPSKTTCNGWRLKKGVVPSNFSVLKLGEFDQNLGGEMLNFQHLKNSGTVFGDSSDIANVMDGHLKKESNVACLFQKRYKTYVFRCGTLSRSTGPKEVLMILATAWTPPLHSCKMDDIRKRLL
ncbi:hypothetical protein RJT34_30563 [Clitoria ternatea]|uniref:Uncharacterized protein n=1 Tax=Clitoria ternatea TaxID=43366 RepID=A0AAN9EX79_CLITE